VRAPERDGQTHQVITLVKVGHERIDLGAERAERCSSGLELGLSPQQSGKREARNDQQSVGPFTGSWTDTPLQVVGIDAGLHPRLAQAPQDSLLGPAPFDHLLAAGGLVELRLRRHSLEPVRLCRRGRGRRDVQEGRLVEKRTVSVFGGKIVRPSQRLRSLSRTSHSFSNDQLTS
jgi:hypothetical protein